MDAYEAELLAEFDKGALKAVAGTTEPARFKAAARAIAVKDKRVNIRLSSGDLQDIPVRAPEQGMPTRPSLPACCTRT
jgi:predicted DNA binding CopG/RHH family protein